MTAITVFLVDDQALVRSGFRMLIEAEDDLEVVGEAARRVSPAFQAAHPEIPWKLIIGQRNVLAHDYGEILVERLRRVAAERIPELLAQLETVLPPDLA